MKSGRRQSSIPSAAFVCSHCVGNDCKQCTDIMRVVFDLSEICNCRRPDHGGEPMNKQIKDPETGTVYGPGLSVTKDGEVKRHD